MPTNQPSRFEQTFSPRCPLSQIIVFQLPLVIRRFVPLGFIGVGVIAAAVWFGVFSPLPRWRLSPASNSDELDPVNDFPAGVDVNAVGADW